jgi:hypothetical protein
LGKTVGELHQTMSQEEWDSWLSFYRAYPFDDFHRYHRPAALVAHSMGGGDISKKLEWLQPEPIPEGMTLADFETMKAFGITPETRD